MTVILLQNVASSVTVYLELSGGGSATGLTFSDVSVDLKKEGAGSFSSKALDGTNFIEIGGGTYQINLTSSDTDTLGTLYIRVSGATIKTSLVSAFIAESVPTSPTASLTVPTTTIFGYILDAQGAGLSGASVSAKILAVPSVGTSGTEGYVQSQGLVTAKSDSAGFFTLELVTGSQVDIFIPGANYRRTFQVPSSSTNLFDIP